ncbi:MAG: OsmC family protein [Thermoplasmata archaeon]|nr:OsmC family protein [Thermoplasmata archaeon]
MHEKIHAHLRRKEGYEFEVTFDEWPKGSVTMDEPEPLGGGSAPNAAMMLSSAVGHCLSASLLFCMGKSRAELRDIAADVETSLVKNEEGRWRIDGIKVDLKVDADEDTIEKLSRCERLYEDFCIVTESIRKGIKVEVDLRREGDGGA